MSDLRIDENNELVLENGDLVLTTTELDNITQHLRQRLRVFKGEWYLDRTLGLPYFKTILVKNPNSLLVATVYKEAILGTPGITRLNKYNQAFNREKRTLTITFEATISTGEIIHFEEQF